MAGFPEHPHRGFETVTYMLEGRMLHQGEVKREGKRLKEGIDHKGNKGLLGPGSVQWMTAGRGIIHSEMPQQQEGKMHGFQFVRISPSSTPSSPSSTPSSPSSNHLIVHHLIVLYLS
jgi:redox-sensitive bicupin YhaK (pirin superfamily)